MPDLLRTPVGRFRLVAVAEALSWAGLLVGMLLKYGPPGTEVGVQVFGPIHGGLFVAYLAVTFISWPSFGWSTPVGVTALAAAVPPFGTVVFERWATRTGRLTVAEPARA